MDLKKLCETPERENFVMDMKSIPNHG
jgi:hypothetical protein